MSNYTKERNIITLNIDGVNGLYRLDLSTLTYYGLRGNPVATYTKREAIKDAFRPNYDTSNLARVLFSMFDNSNGKTANFARYQNAIRGAERMDAIGAPRIRYHRMDYYAFIDENFEDFSAYVRENEGIENFSFSDFQVFSRYKKATKNLGNLAEVFTPDMVNRIVEYFGELSHKEWEFMAYYLVRGKYYQYHNGDLRRLSEYLDLCKTMGKEPQKVNNFMREYCEIRNEYEQKKAEYDDARLRNNYAKHANAFNFTFGEYSIVLPTCAQDIVDEGRNMHHCVGGYVDRVVENSTYIVFVRKTDTPTECYLTCQVDTDGDIGQYYLAYDRRISSAEDIAFREAFQNHLKNNW